MEEITIRTPDVLTFTEAAKILGISRPTIYNLIKKHTLHTVTFGKNRYLLTNEVEKLREEVKDERD